MKFKKNHLFFVLFHHFLLVFVPQFAVLHPQVGLHGSWWPTCPRNRFTALHADSSAWMLIQWKEIPDCCSSLGILAFFHVLRYSVVRTGRAWRDCPLPAFNVRHYAVRIFPKNEQTENFYSSFTDEIIFSGAISHNFCETEEEQEIA